MKKVNLGANRGLGLAAIIMLAASVAHAELTPAGLRCEYRRNPLGIDETKPRLSWQFESSDPAARSQRQTAYQVLVASSRQALDKQQGDLWDSGKVATNQAARLALTGLKLGDQCKQTDTRHLWLVMDAANVSNAAGWIDLGAYTVAGGEKRQAGQKWMKEVDVSELKFNFALLAEQVVSPSESKSPRLSLGFDQTTPFETKLKYLDKVGVSAFWLYGFRSAEGTMRDIGLLTEAKRKLERLGKEAYIVCEPVGHPDRNQKALPAKGWRYRINCDGTPDYGCADIEENLVRDLVAATKAFRDAGFKKVFFDDDLRMGNWGSNITGCFCEACIAEFNRLHDTRYAREDLRRFVRKPGDHAAVCEQWMDYNCNKVTGFMKAVNLPGIQVGIMVMHNGDRKHGIDLPAILKAVPNCLVRVGEGHFHDGGFDPPAGKSSLIASLEMHKAIVKDISRLYSENTVAPWPKLRPENMAKKLLIEVEHGLRNIMLMPPQLLDAPAYWEAIAAVLPQAEAMVRGMGK